MDKTSLSEHQEQPLHKPKKGKRPKAMMNSKNYLLKKKSLLKLKKLSDFKGDFESSQSDDASNILDGRLLHEEQSVDAGP